MPGSGVVMEDEADEGDTPSKSTSLPKRCACVMLCSGNCTARRRLAPPRSRSEKHCERWLTRWMS